MRAAQTPGAVPDSIAYCTRKSRRIRAVLALCCSTYFSTPALLALRAARPHSSFAGSLRRWNQGQPLALLLALACGGEPNDLSTKQLSMVVAAHQSGLQKCYEEALVRTPYKSEVRMAANIFIAPSGEVRKVELEEDGLKGMPACLTKAIKAWRFPKAEDETATNLPLIFKPEVVKQPAVEPPTDE